MLPIIQPSCCFSQGGFPEAPFPPAGCSSALVPAAALDHEHFSGQMETLPFVHLSTSVLLVRSLLPLWHVPSSTQPVFSLLLSYPLSAPNTRHKPWIGRI